MAGSLIPNMEVNIGSSSGVDSYLKAIAGLSNAMEAPFERAREKDKLEKEQERYNTELGFKQRSEQRDLDKINMENKSKDALLNYNNNIARATTLGTMTDKQNSDLGNEFTNLVSSGKSEDEAARIITNKANEFATADTKRLAESPSERANRISQLEISGEGIDPTKLIDLKNQNVRDLRAEQNTLDDNAFKEKQFEEQKKQHQDTVRQANQSYALQKQRYDYEINKDKKAEQEKINAKLGETAKFNNAIAGNEVELGTIKKSIGKGLSVEDQNSANIRSSDSINNDSVIKQSQSNIEYVSKYANQPTTQTGIDDSYARLKTQGIGKTSNDIQKEIYNLENNKINRVGGSGIDNERVNIMDLDNKIKILELEKQKLNPSLTKSQFETIVKSQNTLAENSMNNNSLKIGERVKEYQNAAESGMKKETDLYSDVKTVLSDKEVFDKYKSKVENDPSLSKMNQSDKDYYASQIAATAVKNNAKNKEDYDKLIAEKTKTAYDRADKADKAKLDYFKNLVDLKRQNFESLMKDNSEAKTSEIKSAKSDLSEANASYESLLNSVILNKQ